MESNIEPNMSKTIVTAEVITRMIGLWEYGLSFQEISKLVSLAESTVVKCLSHYASGHVIKLDPIC